MSDLIVRIGAIDVGLHSALRRAAVDVEAFGKGVKGTLLTTEQSAARFQRFTALALAGTSAAIGAAFYGAAKSAMEFERALRNVQTIATDTNTGQALGEVGIQKMGDALVELSTRVPQSAKTLTEAMYEIVSTGFQGAEAMQVLNASATAASAGLTDATTAAQGITTVLKAYGESGFNAARVSDVLFEAVNKGRFTFGALAESMGQFTAQASNLGVPFEDAAAAVATISLAGFNAAESSTLLNRVLMQLQSPTDALAQRMHTLGLSLADLKDPAVGLAGVITQLKKSTQGDPMDLNRLFPEIRAMNGVLALTAANGKNLTDVFSEMQDPVKVAGAAQRAFNVQAKSAAFQMQLARNEITAAGISLGRNLLPALAGVAKFLAGFVEGWRSLSGPVKLAVTLFLAATGAFTAFGAAALFVVPAIRAFNVAMEELGFEFAITSATLQTAIPVIGLVTAALTLGAAALAHHGRAALADKVATDAFVVALQQEQAGLEGSLDAEIRNQLIKSNLVDLTHRYGVSLKNVIAAIKGEADAHADVNESINKKIAAIEAETQARLAANNRNNTTDADAEAGRIRASAQTRIDALNKLRGTIDGLVGAEEGAVRQNDELAAAGLGVADSSKDIGAALGGLGGDMDAVSGHAANLEATLNSLSDTQQEFFQNVSGAFGVGGLDLFQDTSGGGGGGGGGGKSAEQRLEDIARAQLGVERATRDVAKAQRDLDRTRNGAAERSVAKAERDVGSAYASSERAVISLRHAEQALEDARRNQQSGRSLAEAQIATTRATAAAVDAMTALKTAQEQLADAQSGGDPDEILRAQRAVSLANADLREATFASQDAQTKLNRAQGENGTIAEGVKTAQLDVADAQRQVASASDDTVTATQALADAQEALRNNTAVVDAEFALRDAVLGVKDAQLALIDAQKDESGANAASGSAKKVSKTMQQLTKDLQEENKKQKQWGEDLAWIADHYGGIVANELAKMGADGADAVHDMRVNGGKDADAFAVELARSALQGTGDFNLNLAQGLGGSPAIAERLLGALSSATGIGVNEIKGKLADLLATYAGIANINFDARGTLLDLAATLPGGVLPPGVTPLAAGDVRNAHEPQIAAAGAMRLWAEPETQGESYIPHANDWRRPRAVSLWEQTGRILGQFAAGGVNLSALRPRAQDFAHVTPRSFSDSAYGGATHMWERLGDSLKGRGVHTYAGGGTLSRSTSYNGGTSSSAVLISVARDAVKVSVSVGAGADLPSVERVVRGAVDSALNQHVRSLNRMLTQKGVG